MLERLRQVLAGSGLELAEEELLDALWLARTLPPGTGPAARAAAATPLPDTPGLPAPGDAPAPEPAAPAAPAEHPLHVAPPRPADRPDPAAGAARPPGKQPEAAPARAFGVRVPDARPAEADTRASARSLRPLRQRFPDPRRPELDLARTVAAMAETGLPVTASRPRRSRWLSLALVVDDGLSMVLWQRIASDLRKLLQRAGAFRDVRVYGLDSRSDRAPLLTARPYRTGGPQLPLAVLADPTGTTLVLVVSDGVGPAWRDGRMRAAVDRWAHCGPTALVHALPTRLWRGSGIAARPWRVRSHRRGGPTAHWRVADPVLPAALAEYRAVPVPVLEPSPAALAAWAHLLAAPGASALLPLWQDAPDPGPGTPDGPRQAGAEPDDPVLRFRDAASPEAYRLAAHLAAVAPVSPPVMRLVRAALGAPVDSGHLAEVFLGGLMHQVDSGEPEPPPHQRLFDFAPPIRRGLLAAVAPHELLRTADAVATRLETTLGRSAEFPAWVGHPQGPTPTTAGAPSFGWLTDRLLHRLGVPPATPPSPSPSPSPEQTQATREEVLPPGWRPLRAQEARQLGGFRLIARSDHGWPHLGLYLARDRDGDLATVRAADRLLASDPEQAHHLIRTEATCLRRLAGVGAPRLLDVSWNYESQAPWLAASFVQAGDGGPVFDLQGLCAHDGGPPDLDRYLRIGRSLAAAVSRAHQLGLLHGSLTPQNVLVADDEVRLIGWITASVDGQHSPYRAAHRRNRLYELGETSSGERSETDRRPTARGEATVAGALLIALAVDRWDEIGPDRALRAELDASGLAPWLADTLWRCLGSGESARPTAQDLVEAFDRAILERSTARHRSDPVAAARREVELLRNSDDPSGLHRPLLARALNLLADREAEAGQWQAACTAGIEAVFLLREVARDEGTVAAGTELARALNNLAVRFRAAGWPTQALDAAVEAVQRYREACAQDPAAYNPGLGLTLANLSNLLADAGRSAEALVAATEAVTLYQQLPGTHPHAHTADTARAFHALSNRLAAEGRSAEAVDAALDAVSLYRLAVRRHPAPALAELAVALDNFAVRLATVGNHAEARTAHDEAEEARRDLAATPDPPGEEAIRRAHQVGQWLDRASGQGN
ncbi:SAV_2336 N-terminal domain-related protein [Kitasatospora sp. NPDC088134]|uniref:SAV_2336 N-terminal domain-related protein n=1 Tax=Kitasatospora sp. NPDC088134 TaxID=3364071 RepID=UPI00382A424A